MRLALLAAAALGALMTLVTLWRSSSLTLDVGSGPIVVDSLAMAAAALVAFLLHGRFRQDGLLRYEVLALALLVLSAATATFSVVPAIVDVSYPAQGFAVVAGVFASALFAGGTWAPGWRVPTARRSWVAAAMLGGGVVAVMTVAVAIGDSVRALPGTAQSSSADTFGANGDVDVSLYQSAAALLFLVAAFGASRLAARHADELLGGFAVAAVLAAGSRAEFAASAASSSRLALAASLLRIAFYAVLAACAVQEIQAFWRRSALLAVLEERRRIARDLHDGLAQELAFVATQARVLVERGRAAGARSSSQPPPSGRWTSRAAPSPRSPARSTSRSRSRWRRPPRRSRGAWARASPSSSTDGVGRRARCVRSCCARARGGHQRGPARPGSGRARAGELGRRRHELRVADTGRGSTRPTRRTCPAVRVDDHARARGGGRRPVAACRPGLRRHGRGGVGAVTTSRAHRGRPRADPRRRAAGARGGRLYVVADGGDRAAAVVHALDTRPDVALLDVHMPGGGIAAAQSDRGARCPATAVVMLTVSRDDADLFAALRAGARGYLLKDIDPDRLPPRCAACSTARRRSRGAW